MSVTGFKLLLRYTRHGEGECVVIGKILASDVEGIDGLAPGFYIVRQGKIAKKIAIN